MKKIYFFLTLFIPFCLLNGCSKDFLKRYEDRIEGGVWRLTDVDRLGLGGSTGDLPFSEGQFVFSDEGTLDYINNAGEVYKGTRDIRRKWTRGSCYTDETGRRECDDRYVKSLH